MHGYQLRAAFEESTGGTWPLNVGQVYTTLSRLERDGLVRPLPANDAGQRPYEITAAGRKDLEAWFATPISRTDRPRDELAIKLALALTTPGVGSPGSANSLAQPAADAGSDAEVEQEVPR
jgi:DNA-binding PadR family transcriptional regulator